MPAPGPERLMLQSLESTAMRSSVTSSGSWRRTSSERRRAPYRSIMDLTADGVAECARSG